MSSWRVAEDIAAAIALVCVAVACNGEGGGPMTLEEYFTELSDIEADAERRGDAVAVSPLSAPSLEERKQAVDSYSASVNEILGDYLSRIDELNAPEEVRDLHDDYVASGEETLDAFEAFLERLSGASSIEEFDAAAQGEFPEAAFARNSQLCRELEQFASTNEIEADLKCADG